MTAGSEVVAIDGPSGAGKGTVARAVAATLGWRHVDTGAMYRAVAWSAAQQGFTLGNDDEVNVARVAARSTFVIDSHRILIDQHDVTSLIRTPEMDKAATGVARMPRVRAVLVARQREYAAAGPVVMEGRDIGTVVFPDARVKVYLDATPEERARRRAGDGSHGSSKMGGIGVVADAMATRDRLDRTRVTSPLARARDAVFVDTTGVPIDAVVHRVLKLVRDRLQSTPKTV